MEPLKVGYILLHNSLAKDYLNEQIFFFHCWTLITRYPEKCWRYLAFNTESVKAQTETWGFLFYPLLFSFANHISPMLFLLAFPDFTASCSIGKKKGLPMGSCETNLFGQINILPKWVNITRSRARGSSSKHLWMGGMFHFNHAIS